MQTFLLTCISQLKTSIHLRFSYILLSGHRRHNWREITSHLNEREEKLRRIEILLDELDGAIAKACDRLIRAENVMRQQPTSRHSATSVGFVSS